MQLGMVVSQLESKKFADLVKSVPNSVEKIMQAPLVRDVVRKVGIEVVKQFIEAEIIKLSAQMNVANNINKFQVPFIADQLLEVYPTESLSDFVLCFKRGAIGFYGNAYHKLDAATIMDWMNKHIEEKAMYRERDVVTRQQEYSGIDYQAFKKRLDLERDRQKEKESKQHKIAVKRFLDKHEPRESFTVTIEDEKGNILGSIKKVYAESQEHANAIVKKNIEMGIL